MNGITETQRERFGVIESTEPPIFLGLLWLRTPAVKDPPEEDEASTPWLPPRYAEYEDVASIEVAGQLLEHSELEHRIELEGDATPP